MKLTVLPPHLHAFALSANFIVKNRYRLGDGVVERAIRPDIPFQPTLHWKTKTHYLACEVAERPFPVSVSQQFTEIVASAQPVRILVAYPKENGLSSADYQDDVRKLKRLGIGFLAVDDQRGGEIEYHGVSLACRIDMVDLSGFRPVLKPLVRDAYEHYMQEGHPDVGLQKIGQLVEQIILNVALQARAIGKFNSTVFKPPKYVPQANLLDAMIAEKVLDIPILGQCRQFVDDRNSVSHKPKNKSEAMQIEGKFKENFIIGSRILKDLPPVLTKRGYKLKVG
jgi:hypothetical protein